MITYAQVLATIEEQLKDNTTQFITPERARAVTTLIAQFALQESNVFEFAGIINPADPAYPGLSTKDVLGVAVAKGSYTNFKDDLDNPLFLDPAETDEIYSFFTSAWGSEVWEKTGVNVALPTPGPSYDPTPQYTASFSCNIDAVAVSDPSGLSNEKFGSFEAEIVSIDGGAPTWAEAKIQYSVPWTGNSKAAVNFGGAVDSEDSIGIPWFVKVNDKSGFSVHIKFPEDAPLGFKLHFSYNVVGY